MRKSDFTLPTLDDLFSTQAERDDAKLERVRNIPLAELHPFKGHPFKVQNNEEMQRMIESIRKVGAITPALARPLPDGGYELISGHRRLAACQVLGVEAMPVIVRELSDDEAVIAMVDANLQRETILPSEKAFAYKMKLDAIKHQGVTSAQVGQKLLSVEKVADDAGESRNQIKRYIRLTYLIPELLSMVDDGKIAFNPAVELSYLDSYQQRAVLERRKLRDCIDFAGLCRDADRHLLDSGHDPLYICGGTDQAAFWAATADFQANPAGQPPQRAEGHP